MAVFMTRPGGLVRYDNLRSAGATGKSAVAGGTGLVIDINASGLHGLADMFAQAARYAPVAAARALNATNSKVMTQISRVLPKQADEIMGGIGGSFEQAKGAIESFVLNVGTANEKLIKFGLDGFTGVLDQFSNLSTTTQQVATAFGALAAVGGGVYGAGKLLGILTGAGGLTASAVALDGAAGALTAAAVRLGGAGVASGAAGAAGAGAATAGGIGSKAAAALPLIARVGLAGIVAGAGYALYTIGSANAEKYKGVAPGEVHNEGRNRRRRANELYRERMEEFNRENKVELEGSAEIKSKVEISLEPGLKAKLEQAIQAAGHLKSGGSTGVGSTGRTMPEASGDGLNY